MYMTSRLVAAIIAIPILFCFCNLKPKTLAVIEFQDNFSSDVVSLIIDGRPVFEGVTLTSEFSLGWCPVFVTVLLSDRIGVQLKSNYEAQEYVYFSQKVDSLSLEIKVNGNPSQFRLNLSNGIYVGFDKEVNDKVLLNQSRTPFIYE